MFSEKDWRDSPITSIFTARCRTTASPPRTFLEKTLDTSYVVISSSKSFLLKPFSDRLVVHTADESAAGRTRLHPGVGDIPTRPDRLSLLRNSRIDDLTLTAP